MEISLKDLCAYSIEWCKNHPDAPPELAFREGYRYCLQMKEPVLLDDAPIIAESIPYDEEPSLAPSFVPTFNDFWDRYDYKKARPQAKRMWDKLNRQQKCEIWDSLDAYLANTPDKQYRMHPSTYINPANERWRDELTIRNTPNSNGNKQSTADDLFNRDAIGLLSRLSQRG